jgi:hypothetical protein
MDDAKEVGKIEEGRAALEPHASVIVAHEQQSR